MSGPEAFWISFGLLFFSVLMSAPFTAIAKLKKMFDEPGDYDYISFCMEDLPQLGQVKHFQDKILLSQPVKSNHDKKLDPKQKTIQAFNINAQGFRKTRNENHPTWEKGVAR